MCAKHLLIDTPRITIMIRTEAVEQMDQKEFTSRIVDEFGDAGIIHLADYDLSEVIVSTDETVLWVPDFRTIDPFGSSTGSFTSVETVSTHLFQINDKDGSREEYTTQNVYRLSATIDGGISQLISKDRVATLAEILDIRPDEMVSKAKISPQRDCYPILFEFPEHLGKLFVAPVKNEQETLLRPMKSGEFESTEGSSVGEVNDPKISAPNVG